MVLCVCVCAYVCVETYIDIDVSADADACANICIYICICICVGPCCTCCSSLCFVCMYLCALAPCLPLLFALSLAPRCMKCIAWRRSMELPRWDGATCCSERSTQCCGPSAAPCPARSVNAATATATASPSCCGRRRFFMCNFRSFLHSDLSVLSVLLWRCCWRVKITNYICLNC